MLEKETESEEKFLPWNINLWYRFMDRTLHDEVLMCYSDQFKGVINYYSDKELPEEILEYLVDPRYTKKYVYVKDSSNIEDLNKIKVTLNEDNREIFPFEDVKFISTKEEIFSIEANKDTIIIIYYDDELVDDFPRLYKLINKDDYPFVCLIGNEHTPLIYRMASLHVILDCDEFTSRAEYLDYCIDIYMRLHHIPGFDLREYLNLAIEERELVPKKYESLLPDLHVFGPRVVNNKDEFTYRKVIENIKQYRDAGLF